MKFTKLGLIVLGSAGLFVLGSHQVSAKTVLDTNSDYYMPAVFTNHQINYNMDKMNAKDQHVYQVAFKNWQKSLKNKITFVNTNSNYQVKLFSAKNGDFYTDKNGIKYYQLAVTDLSYSGSVASSAKIYMYDKTIKKMGENDYRYQLAIAEHEIGHLLGLGEFDHAKNDVMSRYSELGSHNKITKLDIQEASLENHLGVILMDLIKVLKKERLKQKLTQEDLADKADVSSYSISNIELGNTSPTLGLFVRIANKLGFKVLLRPTKKVVSDLQSYSSRQLLEELERRNDGD